MNYHQQIDARSIAFGRALARRIEVDPSLVEAALRTIDKWKATSSDRVKPALAKWEQLLRGPVEDVIRTLTSQDESCVELRQSNPFAGQLSMNERNAILQEFAHHATASA